MSMDNQTQHLNQKIQDAYDDLPYESYCFPFTSPENIAAIATIYGLTPVNVATARVLELGSASGGNLIPFAIKFPQAKVVGVDLSQKQIDDGIKIINDIGLDNLSLEAKDILTIDDDFGQFDYIICHGVYSWVPQSVRKAILKICQNNLSEHGVAYISYNTYPGWKTKEMIRDAMLLSAQGSDNQVDALANARKMYQFLDDNAPKDGLLKNILTQNSVVSDQSKDYYLIHEYLEPINEPCYFQEFINAINSYDMAYLSDAQPSESMLSNYEDTISQPILKQSKGDQELAEQYLDFLSNRKFRKSLIVNADKKQHINRTLTIENFKNLHLSCYLETNKLTPDNTAQAVGKKDLNLTISDVFFKAIIKQMNKSFPSTVSIETLIQVTQSPIKVFGTKYKHLEALSLSAEEAQKRVLTFLTVIFNRGLGDFSTQATQVAKLINKKEDKPYISAKRRNWAKSIEKHGHQKFSSLFHQPIALNKMVSVFVSMCDGEHTYDDILAQLTEENKQGHLTFYKDGKKVTHYKENKKIIIEQLNQLWKNISESGLLETLD